MISNQTLTCEKGNTFSFEIDMQGTTDLTNASGSWVLAESWFDNAKVLLTKPLTISYDAGVWKASVQLNPADTLALPVGTFFHDSKVALGDGTIGHVSSGTFILDTRTISEPLECERGDDFLFEIDIGDAVDLTGATATWTLAESWFDGARGYITKTNGSGLFIDASAKKIVVQLIPQDTIGIPSGTMFHACDVTLSDGTVGRVASGTFILEPSVDIAVVPTISAHATQTLGALGQTVALTSPRSIAAAQTLGPLGQAATATAGGSVSPDFQTDFTAISSLPTGVSHTRGSNAMVTDSTGKLTYGPNNLFLQSNNFSDASWQKSGTASVTAGFTDPVGGSSATRLDLPAVNDFISQFVNPFPTPKGIHSVWVRSDTAGTIHLNDGSGGVWNVSVSVGTTWALVDTGPQVQASSAVRIIRASGDLASLYIYNQVLAAVTYETTARSADQVITTSSPYYGPRLDHNPVSPFAATGLLIEEQRTNIILQSNNPSDAAWTKDSGGSINATNRAAPDGTNTASTFTTSSNGGRLYQSYVSTSGQPYTLSRWIRRRTGSGAVKIWNQSSVEVDITSQVSSVWNRINFTDTSSGTGFNMLILGTAGDEIDIYGAGTELGSFATSYIPTTSAAVTRSADNVNITGSDFTGLYNQPANTFILEFTMEGNLVSNQYPLGLSDGAGLTNFVGTRLAPPIMVIHNFTGAGVLSLTVPTVNVPTRVAFAQAANDHSASQDGGSAVTSTATAAMPTLNRLDFGDLGGPGSIYKTNMWLRGFAAYKSRLPDATLQTKSVVGAAF